MTGRLKIILFCFSLIIAGIIGTAYIKIMVAPPAIEAITWADADNLTLVKRGKPIYENVCANCHGMDLQGQPKWRSSKIDGTLPAPPHSEKGHTWQFSDADLFDIAKFGGQKGAPEGFVSGMPEFGDILGDDDIWAVLAYIKSRWPEKMRKHQANISKE